jgi:IMP dehydrogenase
LPRSDITAVAPREGGRGLETVLFGPSESPDGTLNLFGALRRALAKTGYSDLKEFQRVGLNIKN